MSNPTAQLRLVISADNSQLITATHSSQSALQALQNQAARPISNQFSTLQNQLQNVQVTGNTATQSLFNFNTQAGQPLHLNTHGLQADLSALNSITQQAILSFHGLQQQASQPIRSPRNPAQPDPISNAYSAIGARSFSAIDAEIASVNSSLALLRTSGVLSVQELANVTELARQRVAALNAERLGTVTGETRGLTSAMNGLALAAGTLFGIYQLLNAGKKIVQDTAELEDFNTRLSSVTASAQEFASAEEYLVDLAHRHHKSIGDLSVGLLKTLNLEKSGVITRKQSIELTEGLSNAASALGANSSQLGLVFYGLGQALTSTSVQLTEIQQIVEPLPGLMQALDKATGLGAGGLRKLQGEGKLTADVFANLMVKALHDFDGASEKTGSNLNAKFADIKTSYQELLIVLEKDINSGLTPLLESIANLLKSIKSSINETDLDKLNKESVLLQKSIALHENQGAIPQALDDYFYGNFNVEDAKKRLKEVYDERDKIIKERAKETSFSEMGRQQKEKTVSDLLVDAEKKYNLPAGLISAIAKTESGLSQDKTSPAGAVGVMQVVPSSHPEFDASKLKSDAAYNIDAGAQYLAQLIKLFDGDLNKAIAAYNAGQNAVIRNGGIPPYVETQNYVKTVLKTLEESTGLAAGTLTNKLAAQENERNNKIQAITSINEAKIDAELKNKTAATNAVIDNLKVLKEQGKIGLTEYFNALTKAQQEIINAQIKANRAKLTDAERDYSTKKDITKPEDLPTLDAGLAVKRTQLNAELNELQTKLNAIEPANIIDLNKELAKADKIKNEVDAIQSESSYKNALGGIDAQEQQAQTQLELGNITQLQLLDMQRGFEQQRFDIAREYHAKRLELAQDDLKEQAKINADLIDLQFSHINKLRAFEDKTAIARKAETAAQFEPLANAIEQTSSSIITGQQGTEQAIKRSLANIVVSYISSSLGKRGVAAAEWAYELSGLAGKDARERAIKNAGEAWDLVLSAGRKARLAGEWIWEMLGFGGKETAKVGAKVASETMQTGTAAAGATARAGIESAANAKSGLGNAWRAAKGAFASVMEIVPFPFNVVLAPIAGAAAFAGTMVLGSAKKGEWRVTEDGKTYELHKDEAVLPEGVASHFRTVVDIVKNHAGIASIPPISPITTGINAALSSGQLKPLALPQWAANAEQNSTKTANQLAHDRMRADQRNNNTQNIYKNGLNLTIQAWDGVDVERAVNKNSDTFVRLFSKIVRNNKVKK